MTVTTAVISKHPTARLDKCGDLKFPHGEVRGQRVGKHHEGTFFRAIETIVECRSIYFSKWHGLFL
jgi:hypothetical protein